MSSSLFQSEEQHKTRPLGSCALPVPTQALHLDILHIQLSPSHMGRVKSIKKNYQINILSFFSLEKSLLVQQLKWQFRSQVPCHDEP